MKQPTIFITYNTGSEFEQTLAVRLHTIGAVHGFQMLMPDRHAFSTKINQETSYRIKQADYFILFSTTQLSKIVQAEIEAAYTHLKDKSRILIIYDKKQGKNLINTEHCTEIYIDSGIENIEQIVQKIISSVKTKNNRSVNKAKAHEQDALGGLLLAGLGLLLLGAILDDGKK